MPRMMTPGMMKMPMSLARYQKLSPSLEMTIVESGSPMGVRAAPMPMAKQAMMVVLTFFFLSMGRALMISDSRREAMMAVMILDIRPRMAMTRKTKKFRGM